MISDLPSYLKMAAAEPFKWGETDCCMFLADWIRWKHAKDLASEFLGRYHSQRGAQLLIKREGGVIALLDKRLLAAGFPRTKAPVSGDAGVIITPLGETAAICTETGWVFKSAGGLIAGKPPAAASWKL